MTTVGVVEADDEHARVLGVARHVQGGQAQRGDPVHPQSMAHPGAVDGRQHGSRRAGTLTG